MATDPTDPCFLLVYFQFELSHHRFHRCSGLLCGRPTQDHKVTQMTQRKWCWKETEELVGELNLVVKGWGNYFRLGSVNKADRAVDGHVRYRLRRWLCDKHKVKGHGRTRFHDPYLYKKLSLFRLELFSTTMPRAAA